MSLILNDLSVAIGRRTIVRGVSVTAGAGECLALLGRNGAGKTTLVRGLAGLWPVTGEALLEGKVLTALSAAARSRLIGYVSQDFASVTARLSVLELLLLVQNSDRMSWQPAPDSLERAHRMLDMLRLTRFAGRMPGELSGGQRQMVMLALALVRQPRLLLLDEPTSALDLANQLHMLELVRDYTRREGIVTVMILHDLSLAARFADRALMLEDGRVIHEGPVGAVMTETRIAQVYGVSCHVLPVPGGTYRAVYPVAPLTPGGG